VAHVSVKRFTTRQREEYATHYGKSKKAVIHHELSTVDRIYRGQNMRMMHDPDNAKGRDRRKPYEHDRPEGLSNDPGSSILNCK
jgi:hypothetical protein